MIGDVWKGRKCAGKNRSERVFSDSGGENVKSDGFEREGQGQYYIDNFEMKAVLQVSSHARQDSQSPSC